jgi:hypothetical protein
VCVCVCVCTMISRKMCMIRENSLFSVFKVYWSVAFLHCLGHSGKWSQHNPKLYFTWILTFNIRAFLWIWTWSVDWISVRIQFVFSSYLKFILVVKMFLTSQLHAVYFSSNLIRGYINRHVMFFLGPWNENIDHKRNELTICVEFPLSFTELTPVLGFLIPNFITCSMRLLTLWGSKITFPNPCCIDCQSYLLLFLTSAIFCLVTPNSLSELLQVHRTLRRHNMESKNLYSDHR